VRDEAEHKGGDEAGGLGARRWRDAEGVSVRLRRAERADVDFVTGLLAHEQVEPFLSVHRGRERTDVLARIERSQGEAASAGVFVIEADGRSAGVMGFETFSERSRIADLGGLALHPEFRGRGMAHEAARVFVRHLLLDLGFHRLQLEVYGFNERAVAHAERVGFVREGVKRRAYRRHGQWADGVLFALVREDLGLRPAVDVLYEYVARHNQGVRSADWEPRASRRAISSARSSSSSSGTQRETSPMRSASTPSTSSHRSRWYFAFAIPQSSGQMIAA